MAKKNSKRLIETPQIQKISTGLNRLQQTISFQQALYGHQNCECLVCRSKNKIPKNGKIIYFNEGSQQSDKWLLKVLTGLCNRDAPTLKIYIPDVCFIDGDILHVFHTDTRDYRIKKLQGTTPTKALYLTMLRLKKQYKQMLEQNFQKSILNQINPQFIHQKYYEHILPSHFTDSQDSIRLQNNKATFMKYVFHKDSKLLIQSIQQHKLNQNQPFCSVRFLDGNMQLFSKREFQNYTLVRVPNDIVFVQSYIKQKQQEKANYTSMYSFGSKQINNKLFQRAQKQILILIGGIGKYSEMYEDIQNFEDSTIEMMKIDINLYIQYMTYKIVHYLAMVSRIYIKHIKLNWVLNDINVIYVQSIFEFQTTELPLRNIKYRLPPKQENLVFYKDSENFINLYKQIQLIRQKKRVKIQSILKNQIQLQKSLISTVDQTEVSRDILNRSKIKHPKLQKISQTISVETKSIRYPHLRIRSRQIQDRTKANSLHRRKSNYTSMADKYMFQ